MKNISVMGLYWGAYGQVVTYLLSLTEANSKDPMVLANSIFSTVTAAESGVLKPHVSRVFPLSQVNEACDFVASRKSTGKVLIDCQSQTAAKL